MVELLVVGALIRDPSHRVYVQRRSPHRRLLPGTWDIVGGHVEPGETPDQALAREIAEETGWRLRRVEAVLADWAWDHAGVVRRELDYLVEVDGDLDRPVLEEGKHDACAWVGPGDLELLMAGRSDGDRRLRDVVARGVRTRVTERLLLVPVGPGHGAELERLHADPAVARWYWGAWPPELACRRAAEMGQGWEREGVHRWLAYERATGDLVGRGGLAYADDGDTRRLDVGWTLRGDRWGLGYATEIGRESLRLAFEELGEHEATAIAEPHNVRSRAVMERLGMRYCREIRHDGTAYVLYSIRAPWAH